MSLSVSDRAVSGLMVSCGWVFGNFAVAVGKAPRPNYCAHAHCSRHFFGVMRLDHFGIWGSKNCIVHCLYIRDIMIS